MHARLTRAAEVIGFAGIAAATVLAALVGLAACRTTDGHPSPRAPYTEDADAKDYLCQYDGNRRCPITDAEGRM